MNMHGIKRTVGAIAITCALQYGVCGSLTASASSALTAGAASPRSLAVGNRCANSSLHKPRPIFYAISEAGKPGAPHLSGTELETLARIRSLGRFKSLRFAKISHFENRRRQTFVVFDSRLGDCPDSIPGYGVLNGPCNLIFNPVRSVALFYFPSCIDHEKPL